MWGEGFVVEACYEDKGVSLLISYSMVKMIEFLDVNNPL